MVTPKIIPAAFTSATNLIEFALPVIFQERLKSMFSKETTFGKCRDGVTDGITEVVAVDRFIRRNHYICTMS